MSLVIGLTGPIGCGKSTIAAHLAVAGGYVIDADDVARDVTDEPASTEAIAERFGPGVTTDDGRIDRAALAAIVFDDPVALRQLEAIVHPAVRSHLERALSSAAAMQAPFVVIEAIKLVEGGLAARCDEVWLVVCDRPTQRQRLAARGMASDDAERRMDSQADLAERLSPAATRILRTDGPLRDVLGAVDDALARALDGSGGDGPQAA